MFLLPLFQEIFGCYFTHLNKSFVDSCGVYSESSESLVISGKVKSLVHIGNESEGWAIINICIHIGERATVECSLDLR